MQGYDERPINPLPMVVWLLCAPILACEILFALGSAGILGGGTGAAWRVDALQRFAFAPNLFRLMFERGVWPPAELARLVTYPFVHANFTHALFVLVFVLALGKMVGEIFRGWAVAVVFLGSSIIAAVVYAALPFTQMALVGGYPGAHGLIGAFTWLLWTRLGMEHANQARAFTLIGFLMGIQLIFGIIFQTGLDWIADLVGFAVGFGLSFFVAPGGWRRALSRIRRR